MPEVPVTAHSGTAVTPFNTALAELRIQVFREWPYLYEGTLAYEQHYLGESVLLPEYRRQGIGHRFFEAREAQAMRYDYKYAAFCAVNRADNGPDYSTLDSFWHKRGDIKHPKLQAIFDWREVGQSLESSHTLSFWIKKLEPSQP